MNAVQERGEEQVDVTEDDDSFETSFTPIQKLEVFEFY